MAEYLIREEQVVELADIVRGKFTIYDDIIVKLNPKLSSGNIMVIPDGATNIGRYAFAFSDYDEIIMPDSVTSVAQYAFAYTGYNTKILFSKNLTTIDVRTFYYSNLKEITLPDNITSISGSAFYGCSYLADIYLNSTVPPNLMATSAFPSNSNLTIHVPIGSGDAYKTATNWSTFADKIVEDIVME